jgi:hypothetical protein
MPIFIVALVMPIVRMKRSVLLHGEDVLDPRECPFGLLAIGAIIALQRARMADLLGVSPGSARRVPRRLTAPPRRTVARGYRAPGLCPLPVRSRFGRQDGRARSQGFLKPLTRSPLGEISLPRTRVPAEIGSLLTLEGRH